MPAIKDKKGISNHYVAQKGKDYFKWQRGWGEETGKIEARKFQKLISLNDDTLDFGCGGGYILNALTCRSKIGVEVNEAAMDECRLKGIPVTDDISTIPDESIDVVISNHSLEHVHNPFISLTGIFRILRPNGRLVAFTPIDDWRSSRSYNESDVHHHLYTWTPQNFGNLLTDVGFKLERITLFTYCWPPKVVHLNRALPEPLFDFTCRVWGTLVHYRQIKTLATKPI